MYEYDFSDDTTDEDELEMDAAAAKGDLEKLKTLHESKQECTVDAIDAAAKNGYFEVVKWLIENRTEGCTTLAMDKAARRGHRRILQFLHETGASCTFSAMDYAYDLDTLIYLHNNTSEGCTAEAMDIAAKRGRLDMVQWHHFNRDEGCTTNALDYALIEGHLDVMNFLIMNRKEGCTAGAISKAKQQNRPDIQEWLDKHAASALAMSVARLYSPCK